jgi:hypothetical protein
MSIDRNVRATKTPAATTTPAMTSMIAIRDSGRHVGSGGTSNVTSISPASAALSSRMRVSSPRIRSTTLRRTGNGFADGWLLPSALSVLTTSLASR